MQRHKCMKPMHANCFKQLDFHCHIPCIYTIGIGYTTPMKDMHPYILRYTVVTPRRSRGVCNHRIVEDIRGAYPPSRCGFV